MAEPITIRISLTGPFAGKSIQFGRYQFVDGDCYFVGTHEQVENVTRYFVRSYQAKIEKVMAVEEAIRVDDSKVMPDSDEAEAEVEVDEPNRRQADIIAAVNMIEKDKWVDKNSATPRPKVSDVADAMEDPTVNKHEIVEVIKKWLS